MSGARRVFRGFTFVLAALCGWAMFANVFSDDSAVRAQAGQLARTTAGCGDRCKVTAMRGDRGMLSESIVFDIAGHGAVSVTCRRAFVVAGAHSCQATAP